MLTANSRLRVDSDKILGNYLALALHHLWRQGYFSNLSNKWIGQAGINLKILSDVEIPLPPLAHQRVLVFQIEE